MRKFVILILAICNVAFAQGKSEGGGSIEGLQNLKLQNSLKSLVMNIPNEDFRRTIDTTIQSFSIELRSYPISFKIGKRLNSDDIEDLISMSEDKKELVIILEKYQESPARAFYNIVNFMVTTRLERSLTATESQKIIEAMAKSTISQE